MTQAFWLAVVAYLVPTISLGYFWHLKVFTADYDRLDLYRTDVATPLGLASILLQGLAYAWLYPQLFDTSHEMWMESAFVFALVFGLLAWSFSVLPIAARHRMRSVKQFIKLETAYTVVQFAIVSPLIALAWRTYRR
jgi:hypothetical protein